MDILDQARALDKDLERPRTSREVTHAKVCTSSLYTVEGTRRYSVQHMLYSLHPAYVGGTTHATFLKSYNLPSMIQKPVSHMRYIRYEQFHVRTTGLSACMTVHRAPSSTLLLESRTFMCCNPKAPASTAI